MHSHASLALALGVMAVSGYAVIAAWFWPWKAALFPLAIGIPLFVLSAAEAAWVLFGKAERSEVQDFQLTRDVAEREVVRRSATTAAWIVGFFAAIVLFGFPVAVPFFVFLYLKQQADEGWIFSTVFTAAVWAFFYGLFDRLLHLPFPAGWAFTWIS
ncbi:MAG TPA: tripartite tricarboxylate transporter TctB family protein [Burkholderiales bacterium]|nr:tripartite tricarboxylate transporter TctB family protein [Burkholderiales bacterium]